VLSQQPVRVVPAAFLTAPQAELRHIERPTGLRFGLHLGSYTFPGGPARTAETLHAIAVAAEEAGFDALYVMDHFRQIPQLGRPFEDFLESWTTLSWLAGATSRIRLGTLVTGITYRNVAHLGKIVATLDVLSGGRAICGLGLAWFAAEHTAYGFDLPPVPERYALLEDALRLLPALWGKGTPAFAGKVLTAPEALCYPRPLQDPVPIVVGGGGEKRTLRLAARYAHAANIMGDLATVRHKAEVLRLHCVDAGRDPADVELTHLSTVLLGDDDRHVADLVERLRPRRQSPAGYAAAVHAGTTADHVGRFRELAEAGVAEVTVRLADLTGPEPLRRFATIIDAFRDGSAA
jgi:F420-dependent oxidoreductase-like protein